jgi:hypothetical protein
MKIGVYIRLYNTKRSIKRRAKLLAFNSVKSTTVELSYGLLERLERLMQGRRLELTMRWKRNSKKLAGRSYMRLLRFSVKLS